ncbi:hypothetical protein K437DRAFT_258882 [Tilletiaria anomala UBC 951]|uniref:MICOS complex subunit n=1 Tax=Tilletiaria anomala (strain ATCC 24038 / CBS 436.72 / UBC 951) TaxID=1037660 RepID=A0A066VMS1_TILAU|nr:uncharacterized protein K437DRAFT_258882 [Tilletiaria anomala UBC 951]KDN39835.1 hypothetical protein K437DRAFT_258882 [Tilletiaria anomala UBC 951]
MLLRRLAGSGAVMAGTAVAVATGSLASPIFAEERTRREKLSIYDDPAPPVTVVEYHTELERQVGSVRKAISNVTYDTQQSLRGVVNKWIKTEQSVEAKIRELVAKDEPITPGILYVGVATLAGSVFGRYRTLPIRLFAPPAFFFVSLNFFLPKLSHNLSQYYVSIEKAHVPALTEQREHLVKCYRDALKSSESGLESIKHKTESGLQSGLQQVEKSTGLRIGNALGNAQQAAAEAKEKLV